MPQPFISTHNLMKHLNFITCTLVIIPKSDWKRLQQLACLARRARSVFKQWQPPVPEGMKTGQTDAILNLYSTHPESTQINEKERRRALFSSIWFRELKKIRLPTRPYFPNELHGHFRPRTPCGRKRNCLNCDLASASTCLQSQLAATGERDA